MLNGTLTLGMAFQHADCCLRSLSDFIGCRGDKAALANGVEEFEPDALITYAQTCVINGRRVPHLVIQGEDGPVMVLLMPEERVESAIPLEDGDSRGVILPVGDGSIAIVGGRNERLESIERVVRNSVTWSI